jgi:hypothetical protein
MSWIQVDISLINNNPKVLNFADDIGVSELTALGILIKLWAYSFDYGKRPGFIPYPEQVPPICWGGENYFPSLIKAGFVDKKKLGYFVHDWEDKYSALDSYRKANRERQRQYRKKKAEEKERETREQVTKDGLKEQGYDVDKIIKGQK